MNKPLQLGRRDVLQGAVAASMALIGAPLAAQPESAGKEAPSPRRDPGLIRRENEKHGATDWQLTRVRLDRPRGFRSPSRKPQLLGYVGPRCASFRNHLRTLGLERPALRCGSAESPNRQVPNRLRRSVPSVAESRYQRT